MFRLKLVFNNLQFYLHAPEVEAPLTGCLRQSPQRASDLRCSETFELRLEGSPTALDEWISHMEQLLSCAHSRLHPLQLVMQPDDRGAEWFSRVLEGKLEMLGHLSADRDRGRLSLRLTLLREDFWQGDLQAVPLSNANGSQVASGLLLYNHCDGDTGHQNWAAIGGTDVAGDLPAPAELWISNQDDAGQRSGNIYAGHSFQVDCDQVQALLEAENATSPQTSSVISAADCSGGSYRQVSWNGVDEVCLLSWSISASEAAYRQGLPFRPLVRFAQAPEYNDLWLNWSVRYAGEVVSSLSQLAKANQALQLLAAVYLPPVPLGEDAVCEALTLELHARRMSGASQTLKIDFACLMPLDGWRQFQPLGGQALADHERLVDESSEDLLYTENLTSLRRKVTHTKTGTGVWLRPGYNQWIFLLSGNGASAPVSDRLRLQVVYRPRKRVL